MVNLSKKLNHQSYLTLRSLRSCQVCGVNDDLCSINQRHKKSVQVASEVFDNDFVSLVVKDEDSRGQKIIFLSFKDSTCTINLMSLSEHFLSLFLQYSQDLKEFNKIESQF